MKCPWPDLPPGPLGTVSPEIARRHEAAPLAETTMPSGDRALLAVRYDDVRTLLSSPAASRNLRVPGMPRMVTGLSIDDDPDALLNKDAPEHSRIRRIVQGAFTPRRVERWRPRIAEIAGELADAMGTGPVDFVSGFAMQIPARVICEILGVPMDRFADFRRWTESFFATSDASIDDRIKGYAEFLAYAGELVAAHRAEPGDDDLLDSLIQARDEGDRLSEEELVHLTMGLILAGHETTGSFISRAVFRLMLHPEIYAELGTDPDLVAPAVEELLRFEIGGTTMLRRMTEDVELSTGTVPAGTCALGGLAGANHDPSVFPDPDRLDVRRFDEAGLQAHGVNHVAFGYGAHYCLGANLARVEAQEAIKALVTRVPGLRLAAEPEDVPWVDDGLIQRPIQLPVATVGGVSGPGGP